MAKASLIISLSIFALSLEEICGKLAALVTFFFGSANVGFEAPDAVPPEELLLAAAETFVGRTTRWLGARLGSLE